MIGFGGSKEFARNETSRHGVKVIVLYIHEAFGNHKYGQSNGVSITNEGAYSLPSFSRSYKDHTRCHGYVFWNSRGGNTYGPFPFIISPINWSKNKFQFDPNLVCSLTNIQTISSHYGILTKSTRDYAKIVS
jgi:hypothetical protein